MLLRSNSVAISGRSPGPAALMPEGVSEFREYLEDSASNGRLLGCEWRVSVFL